MRRITAIAVLLLVIGAGGSAWGVCGDVYADGAVDLSDLVYLLVYVGSNGVEQPAPPNPADADVDGRAGLTIGDVVALTNYLFSGGTLQCTQAQAYSFAQSSVDSVFFPRMLSVPVGVDTVIMPIFTNLEASTQGLFLSYLKKGLGTTNFSLRDMIWNTTQPNVLNWDNADYWVTDDTGGLEAISLQLPNSNFSGRHSFASLVYVRTAPGTGAIVPTLVNRTSLLKPSVEKNGDLLLPVTQYYDFAFPPETLKVSHASMHFDAAGYPSTDSFVVSFTSSGLPISFTLTATEPWIAIVDTGAVGFRTPASVVIKGDATSVGIGNYTAQISLTDLSPSAPTTVPYIDVGMAVRAPNLFPFGDLDCDGIVDISDLTMMIDHLYLSLRPLTPCQP
jgi:hypothetical protein